MVVRENRVPRGVWKRAAWLATSLVGHRQLPHNAISRYVPLFLVDERCR